MNIIIEYKCYYPKINELSRIIDKTLEEYTQKYGESPWYIEPKHNTQFFEKIKTKNLSTKHNPRKTILESNGRYEYMQNITFMILIKGKIRKNVISTYMKCYNLPLLWRKFFMNTANNREYVINHCNRPLNEFDRHFQEWYLNKNPDESF